MLNNLNKIEKDFLDKINNLNDINKLKELEDEFLWKKGVLKNILSSLKDASIEEKKNIWLRANELKDIFENNIKDTYIRLENKYFDELEESEYIDVSLEFPSKNTWHKHPISHISALLEEIFISLWFRIEDGPHIENEDYNFNKLNIPDNHPARDVWDTFWLDDNINANKKAWEKLLLRTHTSPVQIRNMLKWELPIKIIVPWRVFRYEQEDARHTSNFYQLEWLLIWEWVNFWNLKWTLETVMKNLLWEKTELRFRPSIFPFTEPSVEIDVSCQLCKWTWKTSTWICSMCSWTSWVELLWAWMVHPKVLENVWIDSEKYSWFAFWIWIDRLASQIFWIKSNRSLYQSKLELNEQF